MPNNIAEEPNRFIGRVQELVALGRALQEHPIVTVVGPGGSGKTRLVQRLGRDVLVDWLGGVWFVDLVAAAAALALVPGPDIAERVGRVLAERGRTLLILDNVEHLLPHIGPLVGRWRGGAGGGVPAHQPRAGADRDRAETLCHLSALRRRQGRPAEARALREEAAAIARRLDNQPGTDLHALLRDG